MISPVFYAALALVAADLSGDLGSVASNADNLAGKVEGWSADAGLAGALVIQQNYDPLSQAVVALVGSAKGASSSDVTGSTSGISGLASSVQKLLGDLSDKASDFKTVGATDIVKNDINGLSQASADIISALAGAAGDAVPSDLADAASGLAGAFSKAIQDFGANAVQFPDVKAGSGSGSDSASSAAASSAAGSSAAATTAAASSAAGNAAGSTAVVEETVTETVCTHETCTGVAPANGAVRNVAFGGVAAIAAALL